MFNPKKFLDAVNAAEARVDAVAAQIEALLDTEPAKAVEMKAELEKAKGDADKARELYQSVINATAPSGLDDPAQRFAPAASGVQVIVDEGDQPFENPGQFFQAVKVAALYPKNEDMRLRPLKYKDATGMSEGVPADGGYLLTPQVNDGIIEKIYTGGKILPRITKDPIGAGSNSIMYNAIDETSRVAGSRWGGVRGYWVAEGGEITKSKTKFRQFELKPKKVAALCYATDEQLADTTNLEAWMGRIVPDELRFLVEDAVYEGDGVGKPLGILNSGCLISATRLDAGKIQYADIMGMWARRYTGVKDYVWLINQDVTPQLDQLYLATGVPALFITYDAQGVMRMKGAEVVEVEYAATLGDVGDIMLASLSMYQAADKGAINSASSIHVQFITDETAFRFTYRIDGQPSWGAAMTPLHGSNTVSPFVVCASAT